MEKIDPKLRKALSGISGILVTPFDAADEIAPARLRPIVDRAVTAGVHMLVANGNTGEFYGLTSGSGGDGARRGRAHRRPRSAHRRRGTQHRRCLRARAGSRAAGRAGADGASAARPVRRAARRRRLREARRRRGRRPADHALPAQRRHRPRRHPGAVPGAGRGRREVGVPDADAARRSHPPLRRRTSSGSTAWPSRGRRRSSPSARAASRRG